MNAQQLSDIAEGRNAKPINMPLRRSVNGGWQRVSSQQLAQEEMEEAERHQQREQDALVMETSSGISHHDMIKENRSDDENDDGYRPWASEGIRRVREEKVMHKMHLLTGMAAIGGFLFGYDTGVISGALLPIRRAFSLTDWEQEIVVSSTVLAAFFSSLASAKMNVSLGRKTAILFAAGVFSLGSIMLMGAWNFHSLVIGRIVVGRFTQSCTESDLRLTNILAS